MTDPNGPPLARLSYDRAAARRGDQAWLADAWQDARVVLISPGSATPVDDHRHVEIRPARGAPEGPRRFLGIVDDVPIFTVTAEPDAENWRTLREVGPDIDDLEASLVVSAIALEQWHERHGFCPRCGSPTVEKQAGWTRECANDGSVHFPRTDPAVIMLVHDGGDRALLGRGSRWGPGRFSTLAGFVEPGESVEAAVAREVFEETGVHLRDIHYVASQPWPFPASLMLGFSALLDGDAAIHLDPVEMADAGWFTRAEVRQARDWTDESAAPHTTSRLRGIPPRFSISRYLIDRWLDGNL